MIYKTAKDWLGAENKRVLFFGMSGLGKTHVSNLLRRSGDWFHYSVDYRIGTRYMGEYIADNFKREAMKNPFLRELLLTDSVYIASNITFDNLKPVSTYLGKPGDPAKGGLPYAEYKRRLEQFKRAEIAALMDTGHFIDRAQALYGYPHFVCDTGGSICEWVEPEDANDPVLTELASRTLMVWIKGDAAHTEELVRRFDRAPKPMCYMESFLEDSWGAYLDEKRVAEEAVDPDDFIRWTYAAALAHRQPRYAAMAEHWGITVSADDVARIRTLEDFNVMICAALEAR
ncbi:ATPase [Maritimibacter sp. DP1N21-5]|uniref:ATPase n=1 Tax=Maritimibacter sp. DP1N21-5 TaxID=2836867 RepID=UPI001C46051B|nr:ATPase [Maritimibacter sp. DP1N21-5]MBV7409822.1 ATPase [Maritimibacter sp. DP1N21-5]